MTTPIRGRGTATRPQNRFERLALDTEHGQLEPDDDPRPPTHFLRDASRTIISRNSSPDIPFDASLNPYRGCEHGCSYCYARPTHEYLGFSAGLDFETSILVKEDAPTLLRAELMKKSWQPQSLALSGVTDPYQPIEKRLELTRRCLAVLAEFRNPVMIVTKNHLVTRDIDYLATLAEHDAASVALSITTLDPTLSAKLEPRASAPRRRLDAIHKLADAGIPVGVLTAPIIPGLNDPEVPALLQAAAEHGASFAGYTLLRLPGAVLPVFEDWLDQHAPLRKERVLARVRDIRGGKLNEAQFGKRMRGQGTYAKQLSELFHLARRRAGLEKRGSKLSTAAFQRPGEHMGLF